MNRDDDNGNLPVPRAPSSAAAFGIIAAAERETSALALLAQRFPRDEDAARGKIKNAFTRTRLAEEAAYEYGKGGTDVSGPSIRAAEAIAQRWGRMSFGSEVVSESIGPDGITVSEVRAYAQDLESLLIAERIFKVRHVRVTRRGTYKLSDDREVSELIANMAARRTRACILAIIPSDITEEAMDQAEATVLSKADMSPAALDKMVSMFADFDVSRVMLEKFIQRDLHTIRPRQKLKLQRIYNSLRDGASRPATWFDVSASPPPATSNAERVRAAAAMKPPTAAGKDSAPPPSAEPTPPGDAAPAIDAADMLRRIRSAQNLFELQALDDVVGDMPEGADRVMLIEALTHRDRELSDDDVSS